MKGTIQFSNSAIYNKIIFKTLQLIHRPTIRPLNYWNFQLTGIDHFGGIDWGGFNHFKTRGGFNRPTMGRLDQNSGFHGNRKPPLTYNGESDVSTFSLLFFIRSFLYLQVKRTCIKSRTNLNKFEFQPDRTTNYGVSCPSASKKFPLRLIMGNCSLHASLFIFYRIVIKVAGNQDRHKSLHEFDFGPDQTTYFGATCPWVTKISHFWTLISLKPVG